MINRYFLPAVVLMLAAGCTSVEKKIETLPTVESSKSSESLPMYFSADYISPGVSESEINTFTKSLMLNFIHKELK